MQKQIGSVNILRPKLSQYFIRLNWHDFKSILTFQLKNLDFEEVVSAAERASRRREKLVGETPEQKQARLSSLESVWNPKTARKASEKLADFSMCVAAKRTLDQAVLERIIQNWLGHFSDPKDSDLDLDAEKFSELGIETGLAYEMATQILSKVKNNLGSYMV